MISVLSALVKLWKVQAWKIILLERLFIIKIINNKVLTQKINTAIGDMLLLLPLIHKITYLSLGTYYVAVS